MKIKRRSLGLERSVGPIRISIVEMPNGHGSSSIHVRLDSPGLSWPEILRDDVRDAIGSDTYSVSVPVSHLEAAADRVRDVLKSHEIAGVVSVER